MDAVLKLRELEKLSDLRKDGEQFACCLLDAEYQNLLKGAARVLRYRKNGDKYDPLHLYEGIIKGHEDADSV